MVLALAQINPVIGDLAGNVELIGSRVEAARDSGAQLVLFPELTVSGYPPEDLLLRSDFLAACDAAVQEVAEIARDVVVVFGAPRNGQSDLHNSLLVAADGRVVAEYQKRHLPHYGAFDEGRYFGCGTGPALIRVGDQLVGLSLCADLWIGDGPATAAARAGARLILNASASPFHSGKAAEREAMLSQRARDIVCPIAYANAWGGHDELVFDGGSMVVDHRGRVVARARHFCDELLMVQLDLESVRPARLRDPRLRAASSQQADGAAQVAVEVPLAAERRPVAPAKVRPGARHGARAVGGPAPRDRRPRAQARLRPRGHRTRRRDRLDDGRRPGLRRARPRAGDRGRDALRGLRPPRRGRPPATSWLRSGATCARCRPITSRAPTRPCSRR